MQFFEGIGEPPLFLSASVFFALRDAVVNTRYVQFELTG